MFCHRIPVPSKITKYFILLNENLLVTWLSSKTKKEIIFKGVKSSKNIKSKWRAAFYSCWN